MKNRSLNTGHHPPDANDLVARFEAMYAQAREAGDPRAVPWVDLAPRRELLEWIFETQPEGQGRSALVIGCGMGDDAKVLADLGYQTVAFDVSPTAIRWCRERFFDSPITFVVADLFTPPTEWRQAFDLVVEAFIVQALPPEMRAETIAACADFVAPGGTLLAIGLGMDDAQGRCGPPWPLTSEELALYQAHGLTQVRFQRWDDPRSASRFRYWAAFQRLRSVPASAEKAHHAEATP